MKNHITVAYSEDLREFEKGDCYTAELRKGKYGKKRCSACSDRLIYQKRSRKLLVSLRDFEKVASLCFAKTMEHTFRDTGATHRTTGGLLPSR